MAVWYYSWHDRPACICALAVALLAGACGKTAPAPPPPVVAAPAPPPAPVTIAAPPEVKAKTTMTLAATAEINPDVNSRPSPVVVRVYQLKTDGVFRTADFFPLFDDAAKTLGVTFITVDEFVLAPSEKKTLDVSLSPETQFIGAVAAFRDIRNAQWRAVLPAPRAGGVNVAVERARIALTATP